MKPFALLAALFLFPFAAVRGQETTHLIAQIPPSASGDADWIRQNAPLFECPDAHITEIYYFRWHVFHEHIEWTPDGLVVTEFLPPVPWASKWNTICCAAGHHFREGRWLRDQKILDDYAAFWFRKGGKPRNYSFWAADAIYTRFLVTGNLPWAVDLLPNLIANYAGWDKTNLDPSGLYHQIDNRDGMEFSVGGSGYRPTINSYQYGDAMAIARLAAMAGQKDISAQFLQKAQAIKSLVQARLWNPDAKFFETMTQGAQPALVNVREEIGFIPWYFNLPDPGYEAAWEQLRDPRGFAAPFGPPTVERRSPQFMAPHNHDCLWNGPSWPYATTQTLVALANLLNNYPASPLTNADYFALLKQYADSQYKDFHPWIAEDLDALTGKWIVDLPRSIDYNHSGFCDEVISGLVGLRPRPDNMVEVNPLIPAGTWDYFCLENVPYHGHDLTIFYDKSGARYHGGPGLHIIADGRQIAAAPSLQKLAARLP